MRPTQLSLATAIAAVVTPMAGHANDQSFGLEEVVVTAQKRAQNLQDVPISVQVVNGDFLEDRNINQISELSKVSPGFTFAQGNSDSSKGIILRGIGSQSFSRGMDQSVGVVVDGVVASSASASVLDMSDVERVEVLRGPQGMLFGKNASAGLLNITTKRPTDELSYGVNMSYAELNQQKISAYVSGPLIEDKLLGRINAYSNSQDGIIENVYPGGDDHGDRDEWGFKAKLEVRATDNLNILLSANHTKRAQISGAAPVIEFSPVAEMFASSVVHPNGPENDKISDNDTSVSNTEVSQFSAEFNYDIGDYTLTSITSWTDSESFDNPVNDTLSSFDPNTPLGATLLASGTQGSGLLLNSGKADIKQVTQEFRITSPADQDLTYVAGLYLYKRDMDLESSRLVNGYLASATVIADIAVQRGIPAAVAAGMAAGSPLWGGLQSDLTDSTVNNESAALFGQATYHLTETQRLSVGLRYNYEKVDTEQNARIHDRSVLTGVYAGGALFAQHSVEGGPFGLTPLGYSSDSYTDKAISWRLIYENDITENGMVYASVARGYKGPAVNTLPGALKFAETIIAPEVPTNYELGFKSQLWGNRLRLNSTLFYTSFEDFQSQVSDGAIPPTFVLQNAGELETKGLEMDFALAATENLTVSGSMAYVKAQFVEYKGAACYPGQSLAQGCVAGVQDLSGTDMPNSPEWSASLTGRYHIPLANLPFDAYAQGAYYWQDEVQYTAENDPETIGEAYGIADLAFGIEAEDGSYSVQLFVKNAFNEFYVSNIINTYREAGIVAGHMLPYDYKRRVGVSVSMNF